MGELLHNVMQSTAAGFVGVTLIFCYFVLIISTAAHRIRKGDHMHH